MQNKLAISNLAWTGNHDATLAQLSTLGVDGVEVAPGKVTGGWDTLDMGAMKNYRTLCENHGLSIPSFQAFLFGKPHLQLLGEPNAFDQLIEHMHFVAELAAVAGARILVFGAPKNRLLMGRAIDEAQSLLIERLAILAELCEANGVSIGLEAVPPIYGGEIITSYKDSLRIVETVDSPGLVLHLDAGCTYLNGDDISEAIATCNDQIKHFHISQPQLADFGTPASYHQPASERLHKINYSQWLCIEMLETKSPMDDIKQAVHLAQSIYG